jgi:peroxiredoxin
MRTHWEIAALLPALLVAVSMRGLVAAAETAPAPNLVPLLVRDTAIRSELRLTESQVESLESLLGEWNERLFGLRILSPEKDAERIREVRSGFEQGLSEILDQRQKTRLEELRLQALGWQALLTDDVGSRLGLSAAQRMKVTTVLDETRSKMQKLPGGSERELKRLRTVERDRIAAVLTAAQKREWAQLTGPIYDMGRVRQIAATAPELRQVTEWINGEPLAIQSLRGRVVVVHFFAADCINCIRNMPHYRKWDELFADSDVLLIGIHTPETAAERKIEHVRKKVQEYGLEFPVAIDNDGRNWDAWTNRIWPAVYLIDRQGNVRFWWYGELEWQGAGGEMWMRQRIETLLAEPAGER